MDLRDYQKRFQINRADGWLVIRPECAIILQRVQDDQERYHLVIIAAVYMSLKTVQWYGSILSHMAQDS